MAQTKQSPLAVGDSIRIEGDDASSGKACRGAGDRVVAKAGETFHVAIARAGCAATLKSTLS